MLSKFDSSAEDPTISLIMGIHGLRSTLHLKAPYALTPFYAKNFELAPYHGFLVFLGLIVDIEYVHIIAVLR
jgi:hypothetical protein